MFYFWISLSLGVVAGVANLFGAAIVSARPWSRTFLALFIALGSGFMLATALTEMVPESLRLAPRSGPEERRDQRAQLGQRRLIIRMRGPAAYRRLDDRLRRGHRRGRGRRIDVRLRRAARRGVRRRGGAYHNEETDGRHRRHRQRQDPMNRRQCHTFPGARRRIDVAFGSCDDSDLWDSCDQ